MSDDIIREQGGPEIGRSETPELASQMYDLGWENQTSWLDKVQDVELLEATGSDYTFLRIHQKVRAILDTMEHLADTNNLKGNAIKKLKMDDLYMRYFKKGAETIPVYKVDQYGELSGESPSDLIKETRFEKIVEANDLLGQDKLPLEELKALFEAAYPDQELFINVGVENRQGEETGKVNRVDLMQITESPQVSTEEFEYYFEVIKKNQTQLQILSTLRDEAIANNHHENAGHAQGEMIDGKPIYVPVGVFRASAYVRTDVRKKNNTFRAAGQSHELGWYEENTSALVRIDPTNYHDLRHDITATRVHDNTKSRTYNNCLALSSEEKVAYDKETKVFKFGNEGKGIIYKSMRNHYDAMMQRVRGYGITDREVGDKIVTDIVGVSIAINKFDFLMNFAAATGISRELVIRDEFVKGCDPRQKGRSLDTPEHPNEWAEKPVFHFEAKRPIVDEKNEGEKEIKHDFDFGTVAVDSRKEIRFDYGPIDLKGVQAILNYIEWRIKMGDICGVSDSTTLEKGGQSKAEANVAAVAEGDQPEPDEDSNDEYTDDEVSKIASGLKELFGDDGLGTLMGELQKGGKSLPRVEAKGRTIDFNKESNAVEELEKMVKAMDSSQQLSLQTAFGTADARKIAEATCEFLGELRDQELYRLFQRKVK